MAVRWDGSRGVAGKERIGCEGANVARQDPTSGLLVHPAVSWLEASSSKLALVFLYAFAQHLIIKSELSKGYLGLLHFMGWYTGVTRDLDFQCQL